MEYLFEIEQVFEISGRGCVVVPGIPQAFTKPIPVGSKLIVEKPKTAAANSKTVASVKVSPRVPLGGVNVPSGSVPIRRVGLSKNAAIRSISPVRIPPTTSK